MHQKSKYGTASKIEKKNVVLLVFQHYVIIITVFIKHKRKIEYNHNVGTLPNGTNTILHVTLQKGSAALLIVLYYTIVI